jgi:hypothetical protein
MGVGILYALNILELRVMNSTKVPKKITGI